MYIDIYDATSPRPAFALEVLVLSLPQQGVPDMEVGRGLSAKAQQEVGTKFESVYRPLPSQPFLKTVCATLETLINFT